MAADEKIHFKQPKKMWKMGGKFSFKNIGPLFTIAHSHNASCASNEFKYFSIIFVPHRAVGSKE